MAVPVYWNRCAGDAWGELFSVDLDDPHFDGLEGVYMVWLGGAAPAAVCVGSGAIRDKLKERRLEAAVQQFKDKPLLVTWAKVEPTARAGIERWLLESLHPKLAQQPPSVQPLEVNLPGRPGLAQPDAGPPPRRLVDAAANGQAAAGPRSTEPAKPIDTKPSGQRPASVTEPGTNPIARLPLQHQFLEIIKRSKEPAKSGLFGGGGKPDSSDEKIVTELVQMTLREAVRLNASDIHLEPQEGYLRVRLRLDGFLEEALHIPNGLNLRVVSQVRVGCGLDPERGIGASRPEDGRMSFTNDDMEADVRLSTFPTSYGDKVVMRIIPKSAKLQGIEEIFPAKTVETLRPLITRPQGMFVVTGPTGSGKSTTLYAMIQTLNHPSRNIVTLEDPIEKKLPGINQGMIQPKAGLGFADGLRAILRQDPNVIMVGEIRDLETAEIAVAASLTGHMLFTTLHANSALGVITRLLDMGLEPFLIVSALSAISAQRLARRVCAACAQPYEPTPAEIAEIEHRAAGAGVQVPEGLLKSLKRGAGCEACRRSGFAGRVLLFEFSALTPGLRQLVLKKAPIDELRSAALQDGMEPILLDGLRKAAEGVTTSAEVFRVIEAAD